MGNEAGRDATERLLFSDARSIADGIVDFAEKAECLDADYRESRDVAIALILLSLPDLKRVLPINTNLKISGESPMADDEERLAEILAPHLVGAYDVRITDDEGSITEEGAMSIALRVATALAGSLGRLGTANFEAMLRRELEVQEIIKRLSGLEEQIKILRSNGDSSH